MDEFPKLRNYINGCHQPPVVDNYIPNINPTNGKTISMIPESTSQDIVNPDWNHNFVSQRKRAEWLSRIADGIQSRLELFAQAESLDTGM